MNSEMLQLLLWAPFVLIIVIAGAFFLTTGYKRGLWRALLSTAATVVSTVLSVMAAKSLAPVMAKSMSGVIPASQEGGWSAGLFEQFVMGIVSVVLSLVLFSLFMLIFSAILKAICNRLPIHALDVHSRTLKLAGLCVRLVDTVLFALLLTVPLYGTISAYLPAAQTILSFQEESQDEIGAYLDTALEHPVVRASGVGPSAWVYENLSDVQVGGGAVNVAEMVQTIEDLSSMAEELLHAPAAERADITKKLIQYTRENVIEQDWCYDLVINGLVKEYGKELEKQFGDKMPMLKEGLALLDMDKEAFQENGIVLLDFAGYLLESDYLHPTKGLDLSKAAQSEEFIQKLHTLSNSTEQIAQLKDLAITAVVQTAAFDGDVQAAEEFVREQLGEEEKAQILAAIMSGSDMEDLSQISQLAPDAFAQYLPIS